MQQEDPSSVTDISASDLVVCLSRKTDYETSQNDEDLKYLWLPLEGLGGRTDNQNKFFLYIFVINLASNLMTVATASVNADISLSSNTLLNYVTSQTGF